MIFIKNFQIFENFFFILFYCIYFFDVITAP